MWQQTEFHLILNKLENSKYKLTSDSGCTQRNLFQISSKSWNGHGTFAVLNQSENGKYNLISVWFNKIWKKNSLCVTRIRSEFVFIVFQLIWNQMELSLLPHQSGNC